MIALLLQAAPSSPLPMPQTYGEGFLIFALIALGGAFYRSQEARIKREQEALAASITLRRKYRWAKNILDNPIGTTQSQVRQNVIEHRQILSGLLEVLKDAAIVLDDQ